MNGGPPVDTTSQPAHGVVTTIQGGATRRIVLRGEFDDATCGAVTTACGGVDGDVVLDLGAVTFASAAFVTCLLAEREAATRRGGQVVVVSVPTFVHRLLTITGVSA